jgi:hypothetical protein
MRNEYGDDIHVKENIKISVRKNDKNKDTLNTLKSEAESHGYEVREVKQKVNEQKTTDVIPWDSSWDKPETNNNLVKRLKQEQHEPEPPKKQLPRNE